MMQFIQDNYSSSITLDDIASSAQISKSSALNYFNEYLHISPISYLINYRLKKAAYLLRATKATITDIAAQTGFESAGYFCRKFKEKHLTTPGTYRNNI